MEVYDSSHHMRHSLHKYFTDRKWAEAFLEGEVLFRSLAYFRDYEDEGEDEKIRKDCKEGNLVFGPPGGLLMSNQTQATSGIWQQAVSTTLRNFPVSKFFASSVPIGGAFIIVISCTIGQGDFFSERHSVGGNHPIPKSNGDYRVRRTWKAAPAFNKREHAVCLPNDVYAGSKSQLNTRVTAPIVFRVPSTIAPAPPQAARTA
jgi:hypothetical protein